MSHTRDALEFYAQNYCEGWCKDSPSIASFEDCGGCRARRALSHDHGREMLEAFQRIQGYSDNPGLVYTICSKMIDRLSHE